ncbi:MAG: hypothetical protein KDJ76_10635 [Xanthobacteraceae bacterium]|nr:hypothetical protein [Xanthobacteraceae bacterium]
MRRPLPLAAIALFIAAANPSNAADLPAQTRLGRIFAEPAPRAPRHAAVTDQRGWGMDSVYAPEVEIQPLVNGYYGKPGAYRHRSYYGTSPGLIFDRLPYACGFYGYC